MTWTITRHEIEARLANDVPTVIVEALPERHYRDAHIPGAVNMPHDAVAESAPHLLGDRHAAIVVYCANTACRNSHIAAAELAKLGYEHVAVYSGGKEDWAAAGGRLEQAAA